MDYSVAFTSNEEFLAAVQTVVEAWCDRRCLRALRAILQGWPVTSGLNDSRGELLIALKIVRAFARAELNAQELGVVDELIRTVE
jgi:hypothetical protein